MFKSAAWRSQKKIKVVFMMTFQATQVPKMKAKTLMVSLVPADVGKPTVRLGKTPILEGTCSWENAVYETVKLVKETKTGKYKGKVYYFEVSTGSSKGFLGETAIDFVDFLEAYNPVMLSLPLEPTDSGAILHVTVQKLEGNLNERYTEENESPTSDYYNGSLGMQLKETDEPENKNLEETQGEQPNRTAHLREQSISLGYNQNPDCTFEDISDISLTETTNSPKEQYAMDKMQLSSDDVTRMNAQIIMLERQAEVSELELQSLRKQIAKESRKVQELTGKIVSLNQERDTLITECEQLKTSVKSNREPEVSNVPSIATDNLSNISEEINQELFRQKHLNKRLKLQLQKTEDSNSELILAVRDLKEQLDRKNKELKANRNEPKAQADPYMYHMGQNKEAKDLEETVGEQNEAEKLELLKQELASLSGELEVSRKEKEELKLHIEQLTLDYKIEKKEKEEIYSEFQQKQIAIIEMQHEYSDSLTTVKQLKLREETFKQEIKDQALLYSESLATIDELKTEVERLERKLSREAKDFQAKLTEVSQAKDEQERRAIRAEEKNRNANWSKIKTTERLREEFRKKSEEMTSKIHDNEKLAMQAVAEANELRLQNEVLQKLLQKNSPEEGSISSVSPKFYFQNTEIAYVRGNEDSEANEHKVGELKPDRHAWPYTCQDERSLIDDREQMGKQFVGSEMQKKWSEEKEELERKLCSLRKESENLTEENIRLRTLIEEMKKRDEITKQNLSTQFDKLNHGSQELNLQNRSLKKHVQQMKGDLHQKVQQEDVVINTAEKNHIQNAYQETLQQKNRPVNKRFINDIPEGKGEGENTHIDELENLDGATEDIESYDAQSNRNDSQSRQELETRSPHANYVSEVAKLVKEIGCLKEENRFMAVELKEMQERYSEISLKFAEVEGERQQLVMTLRNLRNGKKA